MVSDSFITIMKRLINSIILRPAIISCFLSTTAGSFIRYESQIERPQSVQEQSVSPVKVKFFDLEIVPPSSGVQFYRDGIVFLGLTKNFQKMAASHISFGTTQAYYAIPGDTTLQDPAAFFPGLRFYYPCDAITFTMSYDKMYYTKKDDKGKYYRIFVSDHNFDRKGKGTWSRSEEPLDFCTGNYTFTHPALANDGQMMIFASDMERTTGGFDLFLTRKNGDRWSAPENLGGLVNTKADELYPFLDNSNNLYFSSNGHPGYGGFDIFVSKFNGKRWEEPINLTKLVNTPDDDVAFTLNRLNGKTGFYSTIDNGNRKHAKLYKISFHENLNSGKTANLSEVFLEKALADTAFTYQKLLLAKADDIARAEKEARIAELQRAVKKSSLEKTREEAAKKAEAEEAAKKTKADEARAAEAKRLADEAKAAEAVKIAEEKRLAEEAKAVEKTKAALAAKQVKPKVDTVKVISSVSENLRDVVVYRVQFLSSTTQKTIKDIVVEGKTYTPYIYFYLKEYRYTVGEFTSLEPARQLQFAMRRSGYPQAFVAAFKNNVRSLDISNFR